MLQIFDATLTYGEITSIQNNTIASAPFTIRVIDDIFQEQINLAPLIRFLALNPHIQIQCLTQYPSQAAASLKCINGKGFKLWIGIEINKPDILSDRDNLQAIRKMQFPVFYIYNTNDYIDLELDVAPVNLVAINLTGNQSSNLKVMQECRQNNIKSSLVSSSSSGVMGRLDLCKLKIRQASALHPLHD